MAKKIIISCYPDGNMVVDRKGFEGRNCHEQDGLSELAQLLGKKVDGGNTGDIHRQGRVTVQQH